MLQEPARMHIILGRCSIRTNLASCLGCFFLVPWRSGLQNYIISIKIIVIHCEHIRGKWFGKGGAELLCNLHAGLNLYCFQSLIIACCLLLLWH